MTYLQVQKVSTFLNKKNTCFVKAKVGLTKLGFLHVKKMQMKQD